MQQNNELPINYRRVVSLLGQGKETAITSTEIMQVIGIQDRRFIHQIIEELINNYGYPIGSSRNGEFKGYYLIDNKDELQETLHSFSNQIKSMQRRRASLHVNFSEYSEKGVLNNDN